MNNKGRLGCGCLLFILVCCLIVAGLLVHPLSLRFIGNQFRYEDKTFPSDAIFVPRFEEDKNGDLYVDAFREYWAGNGKVIYIEDDTVFGESITVAVRRMAKARNVKDSVIEKIEIGGEGKKESYAVRRQFSNMGYKKVIILVPEYASRRFHLLYENPVEGRGTKYFIKPVVMSYFKKDKWWKECQSRLLLLKEFVAIVANSIDSFKYGDKEGSAKRT